MQRLNILIGVTSLLNVMKELAGHQPVFVDFTWGAGIGLFLKRKTSLLLCRSFEINVSKPHLL